MQSKAIDRVTLLNITIFVEAFLLLAATIWSQVAEIPLKPALHSHGLQIVIGIGAGVGIAAVSVLLLWLGKYWKIFADLRQISIEQIAPIFADLNFADIILVAAVSGFCEETFFRGVVQQQTNLISASIIFGMFHCPSFKHVSYGLWALAAGLFLGWLVQYTGGLWAAILAHAVSNAISLLVLRYAIKPEITAK